MVKGIYQLPPCTLIELRHSSIWWLEGIELINNGFAHAKVGDLHMRGVQCVDDIWDNENHRFSHGTRLKLNSNSPILTMTIGSHRLLKLLTNGDSCLKKIQRLLIQVNG